MNTVNSVKYDYNGNPIFPGYPDYGLGTKWGWDSWSGRPGVPGNVASLDYATTYDREQFLPGETNDTAQIVLHGRVSKSTLVEIYDNGKLIHTLYSGRTGAWSFSLDGLLEPGHHSVAVKIAGANFPLSKALAFDIDNTQLQIDPEIYAPDNLGYHVVDGTALTNDVTPTLAGKGQPNSQVIIFDEHHNIVALGKTDSFGNWKLDVAVEQAEGKHQYHAEIAGKQSNAVGFEIDIPEPEPAFSFFGAFDYAQLQYINEHSFTQELRPTFEGKATPNSVIYFYEGNAAQPFGSTVTSLYGQWSFTPEADLSAGAHSIAIRSSEGNAELHFVVEASLVESIEINNLVDGNAFTYAYAFDKISDNTPWISGKSEAFANVSIYEGNKLLAQFTAGPDGKWFHELTTPLENGVHTLTALAGNQSSEPFTFTVNAPQTSNGGGYRGIKSFSFNAAEVLAEEESPLFINNVEEQPAVAQPLTLTQDQLNVASNTSGLILSSGTLEGELIEEFSAYQH